ncbi:MAG: hypothetical protein JSS81_11485 [Acidobacteria bacterium]|nr:hypothetical protein [Acidobacteriota bacterium]
MNKSFAIALGIAAVLVGAGVLLIWKYQPSMQEQQEKVLEGAVREGSPEFAALTKRIVAETNEDKTWYSPVGTGYIMMNIAGRIRNNGDKPITGLEIKVTVVDSFDKPVRDNTVTVVPTQQKRLEPKGEMNVNVVIEGFNKDDDRARIRWKVTAIKTE